MKLANSKTIRDAEDEAIHVLGIPSLSLMMSAAKALTLSATRFLGAKKTVAVFAGAGNNGGDGICAAALLMGHGAKVRCFLVGERAKMTAETSEMERRFVELGGTLELFDPKNSDQRAFALNSELIIDAIFGIGLNSPLRGVAPGAVELINESGARVVSADVPSGVLADTGAVLGAAVRADATVTFSMPKPGHFVEPGVACCGELVTADVGIPAALLKKIETGVYAVLPEEISLPRRKKISHKGSYGRLLIIGGSVGFSGAPVLCAEAALRSGAGLVTLLTPEAIYPFTAMRLTEAMCAPLPGSANGQISAKALPIIEARLREIREFNGGSALVIGCGLGRSPEIGDVVLSVLQSAKIPVVIDADGLNALGSEPETLLGAKTPLILTPHEGEFLRLGGALTGNRLADAIGFAQSRGCVLVLKGHRVICAFPDGEAHIINAGNPGMAKGGSGDALAGLIGGFLCQMPLKTAVITACMTHAMAGDLAAERFGEYSMLPRDLIAAIPDITRSITKDTIL